MAITAVAWPSIAEDLDLPIADLGILTLMYGAGYTTATLSSGWIAERLRSGHAFIAGAGAAGLGCLLGAGAPSWYLLLVAMPVFGFGAGTFDAAANSYVAVRGSQREMGTIHGLFGVGAIIGPLLVTGLLTIGLSWRVSFLTVGLLFVGAAVTMAVVANDAAIPTKKSTGATGRLRVTSPFVWSLLTFFFYSGIAATTGVWAFTYLTEQRGIDPGFGGLIVASYWAAFAASRFLLGTVSERMEQRRTLRYAMILTVVGYFAFWLSPWPVASVLALIVAGFAHGPFFPIELLETRERFGTVRAPAVIGYQIGGVNIGGAIIPAGVGLLVSVWDLTVVPPVLALFAVLTFGATEKLNTTQPPATVERPVS